MASIQIKQVAVVGCGRNAHYHGQAIERHGETLSLATVVDTDAEAREAFARTFGAKGCCASVEELLQSEIRPDVAVVSTPTPVRMAVCRPLLEAGIPVLVEKPLSDNLAQAVELALLAAESGTPMAVNQNFRFFFPFDAARQVLSRGELGRPLHLVQHAMYLRDNDGWRGRSKRNVMSAMSIHWLDGYRYMLNDEPKWVRCHALDSPAVANRGDSAVTLTVGMQGGTLISLNESFSSFHPGGWDNTYCQLDCERGGLTLGIDGSLLVARQGQGVERLERVAVDKAESNYRMLHQLLQAADAGGQAPTAPQDNLKSVRFMEAAYVSAARQQTVFPDALPLPGEDPAAIHFPADAGEGPVMRPRHWGIYHREPGKPHSAPHFHDCDEWYLVLEGSGTVRVGERDVAVKPLDVVHIPAGTPHGTICSQGVYRLVFIEGPLHGARRSGHLHIGRDEPFCDVPQYHS